MFGAVHVEELPVHQHSLRRDERGIWVGASTAAVSYPSDGHAACLALEDTSFWFRHRNRCILAAVSRFPPAGAIFDVGGGNGFVGRALLQAGRDVVLVEPGPEGAANARARGLPHVVCATLEAAGFAPGSLPAVGLFDVVEHIEDDITFLRSLADLLAPGGMVYVTVPAYAALWSDEDVQAGHYRRHTRSSLCQRFDAAGFQVRYASMFFRVLTLPILLLRALPFRLGLRRGASRAIAAREHGTTTNPGVSLLERMLAPEVSHIAADVQMPVGASVLLVAQRPG